ncbi:N-6 DNA methylase [Streptomyces sp. NPDC001930]|uniref:N-6 DNA methylase n=1 Tax=Streptomyces sp. NPDC001930 TaxID=3364625 RepID=UPI00368B6ED2
MSTLGGLVWSIADQLRGIYRPHQYGGIILPFTILRRLDCLLEPTRDEVRALAEKYEGGALDVQVKRKTGLTFYNTSQYDFTQLLKDPEGLRANLIDYISRFSSNIDVFERFGFETEINRLEEKKRLYLIVSKFANVDLHPDTVPNAEMGDLYEHLIYKFAEASNEEAGEHYTPRDAIRLMVDLLFAEESEALLEPGTVRTIYDPTAGTGGMLSVAEERLLERNPQARLRLYGQEINDLSYAICKSDMIGKGQEVSNIRLGDTLADDKFFDKSFDFCMSNPPYGVDWKASETAVKEERAKGGPSGRFGPGLPQVSDGQMLFLTHLAHKMRPAHEGGGRAGIVLNGSPLFTGAAESGPSEIRRWLLENDLVDAIIALPTDMFFNTGIATYIWLMDNAKQSERRGKVQLIDASNMWTKMRKGMGSKRKEVGAATREQIVKLYDAFSETGGSKILNNSDFGYWAITIERPLRLNFSASRAITLDDKVQIKAFGRGTDPAPFMTVLASMGEELYLSQDQFVEALREQFAAAGLKLTPAQYRQLAITLGEPDELAEAVMDAKGCLEPDTRKRDTENVPFTYGANPLGDAGRDETIKAYFEAEVAPHAPDAWVDAKKTKVGYEIPFTRLFYTYTEPRPFEAIDRDLEAQIAKIMELLRKVESLRKDRDSTVESILGVETVQLKYLIPASRPLTYGIVQAGDPVEDGVPYIGPSDIVDHNGVADPEALRKTTHGIAQAYRRSALIEGDVVVSIGPAFGKTMIVPAELTGANLTQDTARVACDDRIAFNKYVQWVLRSPVAYRFWDKQITGATFRRLNLDTLARTPIPLPSLDEQHRIVERLDRETAQIDALIAECERLIKLSQERRSALITTAVTGQTA